MFLQDKFCLEKYCTLQELKRAERNGVLKNCCKGKNKTNYYGNVQMVCSFNFSQWQFTRKNMCKTSETIR